ncbi:hypothetical protein MRB53_031110 [Persea americana]|uniref:Uncharacterized protein n=1 Tax=Persea americana TaxID=3435 RepID=A0ACC2KNZ8_PERAE|nr:hypothetical protein MRB53_031110 [Persea americana]
MVLNTLWSSPDLTHYIHKHFCTAQQMQQPADRECKSYHLSASCSKRSDSSGKLFQNIRYGGQLLPVILSNC